MTDELFDPNVFKKLRENGIKEFLEELIRKYVNAHRENLEIHRAIDQAILADTDVYIRNRESIEINLNRMVTELRDLGLYSSIPGPIVQNSFILLFNVLEGLIHRHFFIYPLFGTEEELVEFLVELLEGITKEGAVFSASKQ